MGTLPRVELHQWAHNYVSGLTARQVDPVDHHLTGKMLRSKDAGVGDKVRRELSAEECTLVLGTEADASVS
ncbi:hypothetical protein [Ferrimicrobium sp.]|uniref:hypothetical protein n=1 Tax=Ferrimicrobium sp. TaxID=2926050 RepID=UPI00260BC189|nr:hypothetical protein [Ferrimicrobium sp.]